MSDVHPFAAAGFSKAAADYAAGRPDYPPEISSWLETELGLSSASEALDLGAGTGRFSACLAACGAEVTAVEPVAAMRKEFMRSFPNLKVLAGTATQIPAPDASFDGVICAQSFHWFASATALEEIRRVLKPGGALGLVWNMRDESVEWVHELARLLARYEGETPSYRSGAWRRRFPAEGFGPLRERRFPHRHCGPAETVILQRVLSTSFVAALSDAEREDVAARTRALIEASPVFAGRREVCFPYITVAYDCRKEG
jgi:SAM-dependent methyltransferase